MEDHKTKFFIGLFLVGVLLLIGGSFAYTTGDELVITVTNTERISTGSGESLSHKYLVFTDTETFQNTDTIWYGKWNSSDVQGKLKAGKTYAVKVYGWRMPFFSTYRNIVSAVEVPE